VTDRHRPTDRPAYSVCNSWPHLHTYIVSQKKGATLTIAITLSFLDGFAKNSFTAAKSSKFPAKSILGYPLHLKYVAALPWEI